MTFGGHAAFAAHPLFARRGVPGTHDVALGLAVFAACESGEATPLPRFDKATDDPVPRNKWTLAPADLDVLVFEGWCVGARQADDAALAEPVNALEVSEDPHGTWRQAVNAALGGPYAELFAGSTGFSCSRARVRSGPGMARAAGTGTGARITGGAGLNGRRRDCALRGPLRTIDAAHPG